MHLNERCSSLRVCSQYFLDKYFPFCVLVEAEKPILLVRLHEPRKASVCARVLRPLRRHHRELRQRAQAQRSRHRLQGQVVAPVAVHRRRRPGVGRHKTILCRLVAAGIS
jgi:hypothetical protein